jgi:hypothetical protein
MNLPDDKFFDENLQQRVVYLSESDWRILQKGIDHLIHSSTHSDTFERIYWEIFPKITVMRKKGSKLPDFIKNNPDYFNGLNSDSDIEDQMIRDLQKRGVYSMKTVKVDIRSSIHKYLRIREGKE